MKFPMIFLCVVILILLNIVETVDHNEDKVLADKSQVQLNPPILNSEVHTNQNEKLCIIKDGGHIYDLSTLSQKKYWYYSEVSHNDSNVIFLLSICHPVQNASTCKDDNGICFSFVNNAEDISGQKERRPIILNNISFASGGKVTEKLPEVIQEGSLKYVYENGEVCTKENRKLKYKTELHLQCALSPDDESPGPILMASPQCLFIFVWMTLAACPKVINSTPDPCIIKFSSSEYPLNLHSLHAPTYYTAKGINTSFEINICGPIQNGSCPDNTAVCDTSYAQNPKVLATSENISFDWQEDALILSYKAASSPISTNIYLHCDRSYFIPRFFFSSNTSHFYNFSVYTIAVCNPQPSDCVFEDKKLNVYDLRPLHKKEGNWEVVKKDENSKSILYNLNVCGPVNQNSNFKCPPGPIGACKASVSPSGSINIGYITSNPDVNEDGSISLMYTGGDPCHVDAKASSTRILFYCSSVSYPPVLIKVTASCEHLIEWHTPAACPVNVVTSNDCLITDPLFGHNFNLATLRNVSHDYEVSSGDKSFRINVCGPLVFPCGDSNTAVCLLIGEEDGQSGGTTPAELVFNDGTLTMKFSNGSFDQNCGVGDGGYWQSQILFLCSHDEKGLAGLQYIHADHLSCVHHFIWHTGAACPPHQEVDCTAKDGDLLYDLTPLSNPNLNEIYITYGRIKKYVLNVCRSVIHSKESRCAYDAGACLIDLTHENRTQNLGRVTGSPFVEHGHLKVKYENGDPCNGTGTHTTLIEFECTEEQYLSYPVVYAAEECLTLFKWSSVHACPRNATDTEREIQRSNCTAINPLTNYVFDMNRLREQKPYELDMRDGGTLLITACGNVNDPRCGIEDSGACVIPPGGSKKSWSGGKWNKALHFHMWSTYLEYEGGTACKNGYARTTRLSFICQEGSSAAGPVLIAEDDDACTFFINWYTEEACERHIRCFAHSWERTYDLSPLIRLWGNYEVPDPSNSSVTYLLNVCRPLNPVIGVNCHPGSSSCMVRKNQEPLGLGHPILNPTVVADEEVHLMYAHGSACPSDPGFSLSSRIIFTCNRTAGAGTPHFLRKAGDCQTMFEWPTSLVCPPSIDEETQCQIAFEAAKTNVDLSPLRRPEPYVVPHRNRTLRINLCGANACGRDDAVCGEGDVSYGRSGQSKLRWDHSALLLTFFGGVPCEGAITGARTARVFFECDPHAGLGTPEADPIMEDLRCIAVFSWRTNLTCLESLYKPSGTVIPANQTTTTAQPDHSTRQDHPKNSSHPALATTSLPHTTTPPKQEDLTAEHTWVSVTVAVVVLAGVIAASIYVIGRSAYGRRMYARAKRTLARKGYASPAENDTLLQGETAYVYRVDEDEQVLRV